MHDTIEALHEEGQSLDALLQKLSAQQWQAATPAVGWTVAHQVGHLLWSDEAALAAIRDTGDFDHYLQQAQDDPLSMTDRAAAKYAELAPGELLARWRAARDQVAKALPQVPSGSKITWFGPPMSARSMATARLMETWAHGQDIADAVGVHRTSTGRLRDIAHLGVRTRDFAYVLNQLDPPSDQFRIELTGPDGDLWVWGPQDAADRVVGSAEAFCLVVTQRREPEDVDLDATDGAAAQWISIAQVFAGLPKSAVRAAHSGQSETQS